MAAIDLRSHLKFYKDFPTPGINFIDIIPFLQDKEVFNALISDLGSLITAANLAVPEARSFFFATPLLQSEKHIESIIPFRKKGKLPHQGDYLQSIDIQKEYGTDKLFFRKSDLYNSKKEGNIIPITILDDILATGGTVMGIAEKLQNLHLEFDGQKLKVHIKEFVFLGEIMDLNARQILEKIAPVKSVFKL